MKNYDSHKYSAEKITTEHWWFKARTYIISEVLNLFFKDSYKQKIKILDVGSGRGQLFPILQKFGKVYGVEKNKDSVEFSKVTYPYATIWNKTFPDNNSLKIKFNLICLCDVLEHVLDTNLILDEVIKRIADDGYLLITVPSGPYSKTDIDYGHYKRYSRKELVKELEQFNLKELYSSHFMFFLYPAAIFIRKIINPLLKSKNKINPDIEYGRYGFINKFLYLIFKTETLLLRKKIILPYGLSIIGVFKKITNRQI